MRTFIVWLVLVEATALSTAALGWWTVPVVAAIWGLASSAARGVWWKAALAAAAAWGLLLIVTATQGPVGLLAAKLGGLFGLPALAMIMLTLLFPALLAGSAAELAAMLREALLSRRSGGSP